ncbi:MAG: hypothetical protein PHW04_12795 [Candidatus Wallbacteria bacterium]|nr:hypothetical protein [Candidatus Wallbacteria bacterium]
MKLMLLFALMIIVGLVHAGTGEITANTQKPDPGSGGVTQSIKDAFSAYDGGSSTGETSGESTEIKDLNYDKVAELTQQADYCYKDAKGYPKSAHLFYQKAIALYETIIQVDPKNAYVLYKLGSSYWDSKIDKPRAILMMERAVSSDPKVAIYWNDLGFMYKETAETSADKNTLLLKSIDCYLKAIEINPDNDTTLRNLGLDYLKIGRPREAKHYFQLYLPVASVDKERKQIENLLTDIDQYSEAATSEIIHFNAQTKEAGTD